MSTAVDSVVERAAGLARDGSTVEEARDQVLAAAGGDRRAIEAARDRMAAAVHVRSDDFESTFTLQLLNRVLSSVPINDPLDWRIRWTQRFRKP
jgi:hypothetical protein